MNSFYSQEELKIMGFCSLGTDVRISRHCSIYGANRISIGNHVRIDDFCILSGKIHLGNYIHIAAYNALYGGDAGIEIYDYVGVSSHTTVYAASDDYSGVAMTNPMIPDEFRNVKSAKVILNKHTIIGSHSVILPGCEVREGVAVGAISLITKDLEEWGIYAGIPCKRIKDRKRELLDLERQFMNM